MATNRGGVNVPVTATWNGKGLKQAETQLAGFKRSFTKSFAGIGAGIGGAVAFGAIVDQLKQMASAAATDQKSVIALGKAMDNLGMSTQRSGAEDFVRQLMLATGVADEDLRPALQSLVLATGDLTKAQKSLNLALDISKATGRDLQSVSLALAKGYSGSATGLARLGVGLDKSLLASGDMAKITDVLTKKFGGQAAAAAGTFAGKMERINTAVSEAQETIGYELLNSMDKVAQSMGGTDGIISAITEAGDSLADFTAGIGEFVGQAADFKVGAGESATSILDIGNSILRALPFTGQMAMAYDRLTGSGSEARDAQAALSDEINRSMLMRKTYIADTKNAAYAEQAAADAADRRARSLKKVLDAQTKLGNFNRGIIGINLDLARMRSDGIDKMSDGKKGLSNADRKAFGLSYADSVARKYDLLTGQGKLKKAENALSAGRSVIGDAVSPAFARRVLPSSPGVGKEIARRDAQRNANEWAGNQRTVINNFNFGDVNVPNVNAALEEAKRLARLRALSNGRGDTSGGAVNPSGSGTYAWTGRIQ